MSEIPLILTRVAPPTRMEWSNRLVALVIAAATLAPLAIASQLKPNSRGISTHTQLGLAPCQFERTTGLPCPTCGMTTSWTWFAHGNLVASFYVQPMGMILAFLDGAVFWTSLYVAWMGQPVYRLLRFYPGRYFVAPMLVMGAAAWAWKIFIHLHHIDGWH